MKTINIYISNKINESILDTIKEKKAKLISYIIKNISKFENINNAVTDVLKSKELKDIKSIKELFNLCKEKCSDCKLTKQDINNLNKSNIAVDNKTIDTICANVNESMGDNINEGVFANKLKATLKGMFDKDEYSGATLNSFSLIFAGLPTTIAGVIASSTWPKDAGIEPLLNLGGVFIVFYAVCFTIFGIIVWRGLSPEEYATSEELTKDINKEMGSYKKYMEKELKGYSKSY